jgi:hypothetical protein
MDRFRSLAPYAALALAVAVATPAAAGSPEKKDAPRPAAAHAMPAPETAPRAGLATDLMEQARDHAFEVRRTAARLEQMSRSKLFGSDTHRWALNDIRDDVNDLGVVLGSLEQIRGDATSLQQKAIADARPRVEALAQATTRAIQLKSENPANRMFPEYRDAVGSIYENAAELDRMLDAVLDYKEARARLAEVAGGGAADAN